MVIQCCHNTVEIFVILDDDAHGSPLLSQDDSLSKSRQVTSTSSVHLYLNVEYIDVCCKRN